MAGTIFSVTRAMRPTPPKITSAIRPATTSPTAQPGSRRLCFAASATALAWVMLPMPKAASASSAA